MNTFLIRTFGCQMNKHDSERVAGLLHAQGMQPVELAEDADVIVFMTCCVRENADERLRGQVASLKAIKTGGRPELLIAVGGCIGQRDGEALLTQLPHVDVVFGTHNLAHLPALLEAAESGRGAAVEVLDSTTEFTSDLPTHREHPWHAWVPITVGCNNFCTYCIVPHVRGRERSRPLADIAEETRRLVADGVREITLLGQNVNSYGRDLYGHSAFPEVLAAVAQSGVDRIRFATSHPKDLSDQTIAAMAEIPAVMPYLHLPVQSGSNSILDRMNRRYTREHYMGLVATLRESIPHIALSTDIIVGFPGESEDDFEDTFDLVSRVGYDQVFTFRYSPRDGTPAADMEGQVPLDVIQPRFERLVNLVQSQALERNRKFVGTRQEVLVEGPSKRDSSILMGRTASNKVAHAPLPDGVSAQELSGRIVVVEINEAQNWFLAGTIVGSIDSEG